jgi:hypothetical protein
VSVRVHSLTLFAFPRARDVTPGSPSWPATLQPPCLGREPKARVATFLTNMKFNLRGGGGGLKSGEEFENARFQYLKCVQAKAHE